MTYAASASRPLCFNNGVVSQTQPPIGKSNGLNSSSISSINCSRRTKRVGVIKALKSSSPTRQTLSSNWDFHSATTTTTSPPRLPRFEELDTTNMLLRQRIIFLGSQVNPSLVCLHFQLFIFFLRQHSIFDVGLAPCC